MIKRVKGYYLFCLLHLVMVSSMAGQDSLLVTGKIVAHKNTPLKDVSISVEGSAMTPVLTDSTGAFSIIAPSADVWLMIQPVGNNVTKRVFLDNRRELLISLSDKSNKSYSDQLHINYQDVSRSDVLTSYYDMDFEKNKYSEAETTDQLLQGVVPGMWVVQHSGMPGQGTVGFLRGIKSINATNAPLVIVDGIPLEKPGVFATEIQGNYYNPLSTIDPHDISNVTVLKDPGATAIYGSKGSNGVILIRTLDPKSTQTSINISANTGLNFAPAKRIPQLNSDQYKLLAHEILVSSQINESRFEEYYPGLFTDQYQDNYYRYNHNTDWQDYIFSNARVDDIYFSMNGGSEIATYGLSVSYHNQGGVFTNTNFDRFNVRFVSYLNISPRFTMDVTANLVNTNSELKESAISPETSPLMTSLLKSPMMDPYRYDENGIRLPGIDDVDELGTSNPLAVIENFKGETNNYRFIASVKGQAEITKYLKWNSLIGLNLNTMKEFVFMPNIGMQNYFDGEAINVAQSTNNYLYTIYSDNYLSFNRQINRVHQISTITGFRLNTNTFQADFGQAMNMPENDEYTNLQSGQSDLRVLGGINSKWNWLSAFNQIRYKFKDKYLVNLSGSADFSSRYGLQSETSIHIADIPFGLFYSLGAGWRISEEPFLRDLDGLENLLLRVTYGRTGNDDIGNKNALDYYSLVRYRESSGLVPGSIANKTLKYEEFNQFNAGFDLSFWGSRTLFSVDYFLNKSSDLLIYEPQKSYLGYESMPSNSGFLNNSGWEFSLFQRILDKKNFSWDISANISFLSNEVIDVPDNEVITSFEGGEMITRNGDAVNSFYGYQFDGVYSTYAEVQEANLVNHKGIPYGPGDAIFRDISGPENIPDSVINDYDKIILGSPVPDLFGGLFTQLNYKRWTLGILIQFVYGNEIFNYARYLNERMVDFSNQSKSVLNRWQYEGDQTNVPRALWNDPIGNSHFSSRWIEDGSYIRLKQVGLTYSIPEGFFKLKNAKFYISATNLFTLHNYLGFDPEYSYSFDPMVQGIDYGMMPQFRKFIIGIKIGL